VKCGEPSINNQHTLNGALPVPAPRNAGPARARNRSASADLDTVGAGISGLQNGSFDGSYPSGDEEDVTEAHSGLLKVESEY